MPRAASGCENVCRTDGHRTPTAPSKRPTAASAVIPSRTWVVLLLVTGTGPDHGCMRGYDVLTSDGNVERGPGADTYLQEGPLTTFFRTDAGRRVIDSWSVRLASYRTAEIARIRCVEDEPTLTSCGSVLGGAL